MLEEIPSPAKTGVSDHVNDLAVAQDLFGIEEEDNTGVEPCQNHRGAALD